MKIMASDFDGTLFFSFIGEGNKFKKEDLKAIETFRSAGHKFGLCTGRPLSGIDALCNGILDFDFYILSSGAIILDKEKNLLYENSLSHETMKRIADEFSVYSSIWVHAKHDLYSVQKCKEIKAKTKIVESYDDMPHDLIHCVSFKMKNEQLTRETCVYINEKYEDVEAFRNDCFIDVVAKGVSKGATLQIYKEMIHPEITYGIGDNYNDLPLLSASDKSFTFHSSPQEVKDTATYVVESIAEAIQQIM